MRIILDLADIDIPEICMKFALRYTWDMLYIWYAFNMSKICPRSGGDLPKINLKGALDNGISWIYALRFLEICLRYVPNIQKVCLRYAWGKAGICLQYF